MTYTIYNPLTGEIKYTIVCDSSDTLNANLSGQSYVPGNYAADQYYIVNGQVQNKPDKPDNQLIYEFDYAQGTWTINIDETIGLIRYQRNIRLGDIDRVNPIWYASLSPEQQAELIVYRQALLAVPQQSGFPAQVEWPAKPAWI